MGVGGQTERLQIDRGCGSRPRVVKGRRRLCGEWSVSGSGEDKEISKGGFLGVGWIERIRVGDSVGQAPARPVGGDPGQEVAMPDVRGRGRALGVG